ncbi:MAG: hypothetical protein ORN26_01630 [Candidatus Pacebacteria bacterium]|nr:hypothetical protein [Candidatus Paceibacterota bacterium]
MYEMIGIFSHQGIALLQDRHIDLPLSILFIPILSTTSSENDASDPPNKNNNILYIVAMMVTRVD